MRISTSIDFSAGRGELQASAKNEHQGRRDRSERRLIFGAPPRARVAHFEEGRWLLAAHRSRAHERLGYGGFIEYIERLFGYAPRLTYEKLRVAEALETWPELGQALREGAVSWSCVRELTRVATPESERTWLAGARGRTVREVEKLVSGHRPGSLPDDPTEPSAERHVLRFEVAGHPEKSSGPVKHSAGLRVLLGMRRFLGSVGAMSWGLSALLGVISMTEEASGATAESRPAAGPAKMKLAPAPTRDSYEGPPLLLGRGRAIKVGGYAGLGGAYTRFMGRDSGLMSLEGALVFDHRLSLGLAGYGFTRTPGGPLSAAGQTQEFGAGYGGLALRYSVFGNLPAYGTFGVVLGGGAVNLHRDYGWDDEEEWDDSWDHDDDEWDHGRFDTFLVVQPEVTLNANLTRWLRVGATLGYRFTGGVGRFGLGESDLNGIVAGGNIQLGWF